jgi:hypothetical protein
MSAKRHGPIWPAIHAKMRMQSLLLVGVLQILTVITYCYSFPRNWAGLLYFDLILFLRPEFSFALQFSAGTPDVSRLLVLVKAPTPFGVLRVGGNAGAKPLSAFAP